MILPEPVHLAQEHLARCRRKAESAVDMVVTLKKQLTEAEGLVNITKYDMQEAEAQLLELRLGEERASRDYDWGEMRPESCRSQEIT